MKISKVHYWVLIIFFLVIVSLFVYHQKAINENREEISLLLESSQEALVGFTVDPSEERFDETAVYCLDNASKFTVIKNKSDYILKSIYRKIVAENLQGEVLSRIRPNWELEILSIRFEPGKVTAVTNERWEGEQSFHEYKLKQENNSWKIAAESWHHAQKPPERRKS